MTESEQPLFGRRLARALGRAKKSRKELAKELGVSVQSIGQVINGPTIAMTADNSARSARFLGVSGFWLATGEGEMIESMAPLPTTPFRDLNAFEGQLVEMYRQLSHDRQHDYLIELSKEVNIGALAPSPQNPFINDRRGINFGHEPERRSATRILDGGDAPDPGKRGTQ